MRVSLSRLEAVEQWSRTREREALEAVRAASGISLEPAEVTKPERLARVLRAVGIEPGRTPTGKVSVKDEHLAKIDSPVGAGLRLARRMSRLRSTFCGSIKRYAVVDPYTRETRIHCTFSQLRKSKDEEEDGDVGEEEETEGAAYGRLSCTHPNLQQQPNPDRQPDYGKLWRSMYLPDEGKVWATCDYSQQEPRMAIHLAIIAGVARLISRTAYEAALAAAQVFRDRPKTDFHDLMTQLIYGADVLERLGKEKFKQLRNFAKQIFLGLSYGMGGAKLCRKLGLQTKFAEGKGGRMYEVAGDEGQAIIDKFNAAVPFVKQIAWAAQERARLVGYIVTLSGRRCRFPKDLAGNWDWTHKAFNRLDQGSCADQTKEALVQLDAAGYPLQLQVHDEIDWSADNDNDARGGAEIMENCCPTLTVPFRVDVEIGPSWGEAA